MNCQLICYDNIMNSNDNDLIWSKIGKKELLKTCVLTVNEVESRSPHGGTGKYIVMDAPDWVIVIPVSGDNFLMVKQWRHGENALSIEFPGGVIDEGETPEQGARRELLEETGCVAGKLTYLGAANPNPALMSNHVHFFLAENLTKKSEQKLDSDEYVHYMEIPQQEVLGGLGTSTYPHAIMLSAAAIYLAHKNK